MRFKYLANWTNDATPGDECSFYVPLMVRFGKDISRSLETEDSLFVAVSWRSVTIKSTHSRRGLALRASFISEYNGSAVKK